MMFVDSHCHINAEDFDDDREDVLVRARDVHVDYMLDVCDDIARVPQLIRFCAEHQNVYTTVGVHPEWADKYVNLRMEQILEEAQSPYIAGIGECGLDYHYNQETKDIQIKVLQEHIKASQESGLPLIIHNRESDEDMMDVLGEAYKKQRFSGELHCFSSSEKLAEFALSIGFYLSASGIVTFKNSASLRDIFREVPEDRLLIETDSPYLAPVPNRGKRNEPAFVIHTAQVLAALKRVNVEKIAEITRQNFFNLFKKVKHD